MAIALIIAMGLASVYPSEDFYPDNLTSISCTLIYALLGSLSDLHLYSLLLPRSTNDRSTTSPRDPVELYGIGMALKAIVELAMSGIYRRMEGHMEFGAIQMFGVAYGLSCIVLLYWRTRGGEGPMSVAEESWIKCWRDGGAVKIDNEGNVQDIGWEEGESEEMVHSWETRTSFIGVLSLVWILLLLLFQPTISHYPLPSTFDISPSDPLPHRLGFSDSIIASTIPIDAQPLATFLSSRVPPSPKRTIWLTVASESYARLATPHLDAFVRRLNLENPRGEREELLVLCLDQGCMEECFRRAIWAWGGFIGGGEEIVTSDEGLKAAVWTKLSGESRVLPSRDAGLTQD
jgi:hypothetical protein